MTTNTQNINGENDVPAYLNDLIPYRCPKCGHQRRFATLRELRVHLQNDHSFQMGCIKPQSRASVFSKSSGSKYSSARDNRKSTFPFDYNDDGGNDLTNSADIRESSPLLRSFKDETNILEREVQQAKQNELKNKTISMKKLNADGFSPGNLPNQETTLPVRNRPINQNVNTPFTPAHRQPFSGEQYSDVKDTMDKLNAEVMRSRLNQWVTSDALYKSQDILLSMEEAANTNVKEQQGIVHQLLTDIRSKGERIEQREHEQTTLQNERQLLFEETEHLIKEADMCNKGLKHELNQRTSALEHLTTDMRRLQSVSDQHLKRKDQDLQNALGKMRRLEWERDRLIDETENILKRADIDNVDLRNTIKAKEQELSNVNQELDNLRHNQHAVIEESTEMQARAEESKNLMKAVINAKNSQLETAVKQLHDMKTIHDQLVEESKILTEQADENTNSMTRLLHVKEEFVRELTLELQRLREEKYRLEESTSSLEEETHKKSSFIDQLKDDVKSKEKSLQITQSELTDLKEFLQSAAAKERGARKKLEKFIDELIHRAEKAEAELRTLRSQSTNTSETSPVVARPNHEQNKSDADQIKLNEQPLLKSTHGLTPTNAMTSAVSDTSERYSLPSHLIPPKPPRTKLKSQQQRHVADDSTQEVDNVVHGANTFEIPQRNIIHTIADVHQQNETPALEQKHIRSIETKTNEDTNYIPNRNRHHENRAPTMSKIGGHSQHHNNEGTSYLQNKTMHPETRVPILNKQHAHPRHPNDVHNDDSNTINTESLITYLNEGLLNYMDGAVRSPRRYVARPDVGMKSSDIHNESSRDTRKRNEHEQHSGWAQGTINNNSSNRKLITNTYEPKRTNGINNANDRPYSQRYQHYRNAMLHTADEYIDATDRRLPYSSDSKYPHPVQGVHNSGVQMRDDPIHYRTNNTPTTRSTALRNRLLRNEHNNSYVPDDRRGIYIAGENRGAKLNKYNRDVHRSDVHQYPEQQSRIESIARRIYERNNSKARGEQVRSAYRHSGVGKSREKQPPKHKPRKESRLNRKANLRQFDSRFPEIYTSMHDLHTRHSDDSEEYYTDSSRRSRSLSPDRNKRRIKKETRLKYNEDKYQQSDNESAIEEERLRKRKCEQENSQKYAILSESDEDKSEGFVELMDENGILWASEGSKVGDAGNIDDYTIDGEDTLPDISDSELDRVSPSGSEAMATKKTNQISMTVTPSKSKYGIQENRNSTSRNSVNKTPIRSDISNSTSKTLSSRTEDGRSRRQRERSRELGTVEQPKSFTQEELKDKRIVRISKSNRDYILHEDVVFQPIKPTTSSIHSFSEKEMTSGGKEVHDYIRKSPSISIKGSPGNGSEINNRLSSRSSSYSSKANKRNTETLEETLARISDKYKSQRVAVGSSKSDSQKGALLPGNIVDSTVKLINEKYKAKRQAIVDNRGARLSDQGTHGLNNYGGAGYGYTNTFYRGEADINARRHFDRQSVFPANHELASPLAASNQHLQPIQTMRPGMDGSYIPQGSPIPYQVNPPQYAGVPNLGTGAAMSSNFPYNPGLTASHGQLPFSPHSFHPQTGQISNQYLPNYPNMAGNHGHAGQTFPYMFPYFHPMSHQGLQVSQEARKDGNIEENTTENHVNIPATSVSPLTMGHHNSSKSDTNHGYSPPSQHPNVNSPNTERINKQRDTINRDTTRSNDSTVNIQTKSGTYEQPRIINDKSNTHSPMPMKESDVETEWPSIVNKDFVSRSHDGRDSYVEGTKLGLGDTLLNPAVDVGPSANYLKHENSFTESEAVRISNDTVDKVSGGGTSQSHLQTVDHNDTSISEGMSMFAAPIEDDLSATCNSNTQSMIDLQGSSVDTDLDMDTESVKRDFLEKARKIRGMMGELPDDDDNMDSVSQRSFRNAMSSASSQASLDFLDNIPTNRREDTKRRRQALSSIFNFLDTASLCKVAEVCREWKIVSRSAKLWKRIELRNEKVSTKFLFFLARRSSQLKVLIIEDIRPRNRRQGETVEDYQSNLKCSLDGAVEQILKRSEASLHTVSITNCGTLLSSKCLWAASCHSRMLKHVTYITDFDPISSEVMWALGSGCRDLQTLIVHPVNPCQNAEKFNTRCAQLIGKCFPVLEKLSIGGKTIDISALTFIAKQCQKLRHIELHHMSMLTKAVVEQMCDHGCGKMKVIKLMSTPIEPAAITLFYEHCKYLGAINIRLSVNDYFIGADQSEDLKVFEDVTKQYEDLKRDPKLGRILKLKINKI